MAKKQVIVAGAAPDTGNLGVSALCYSTVANLLRENEALEINLLGHGTDFQHSAYCTHEGQRCNILGAKHSKRFYQASTFINIRKSIKMGALASDTAKRFKQANALLDISGGDSFTDLYLMKRFEAIVLPKLIAIENNIPLILLPQTYGPFQQKKPRALAKDILRKATLAYARDKYSFEFMQVLLGSDFAPERHKQGVDVAFVLPTASYEAVQNRGLLPPRRENTEVYGINVSGLIYNDPELAAKQYGIQIDYHQVLSGLIAQILAESAGDIWLVPHVLAKFPAESDSLACEKLKAHFTTAQQQRIHVVSGEYDQCEIKGVIAQCDWFVGTRMHSTVASLSNQVPTAAIAYSGKTKGVFATAGQEDKVLDARMEHSDDLLERLLHLWRDRDSTRGQLDTHIPQLKAQARAQFSDIAAHIPAP